MKNELSILMSVWNAEETVSDSVQSILGQSFEDFEFIIVDDGSSDRTVEIIEGFRDPRITILSNEKNMGATHSLSKAAAHSNSRYIARQDGDDISMPGRLQKQIDYLKAHPDVAVLGTTRGTLDNSGNIISTIPFPENPTYDDFLERNSLVHGSIMMPREIYTEFGGYNELFRYSQDYDLWLRVVQSRTIRNLQEPLYCIRRHENRITLRHITQARLYSMLAVNKARGKVSGEIEEQIRRDGIESYYDHLDDREKLRYHESAKNRSLKYKSYEKARHHLKQIIALRPGRIKPRLQLFLLNLKSLFSR